MSINTVIFDWDGTLADSTANIVSCLHKALLEHEITISDRTRLKSVIGLGLAEAVESLIPEQKAATKISVAKAYQSRFWDASTKQETVLYEGVMDTLEQFKRQGFNLCIATGKSRKGLDRVLQELSIADYFVITRTADETLSKPDPLMLNEIVELLDIAVSNAVMVGDTSYDLDMAKAIGMLSVGIDYGAHPREVLSKSDPAYIISNLTQLMDCL